MNKTFLALFTLILLSVPSQAANTSPTLVPIPDQTVYVDHPALVELLVSDTETPTNLLSLKLSTSNPTLINTNKNVVFHWFTDGGAAMPRWYMTVAPTFGMIGTATNTVTVSDGTNNVSASFVLTVVPPPVYAARFANTNQITIPASGIASQYPSTMNVSGMVGTITDVVITLSLFTHQNPNDLHMLLVSPTGRGMVFWSKVGGGGPFGGVPPDHFVTNVTATVTDEAPDWSPLPPFYFIWTERFRPGDYAAVEAPANNFPAPAPAGPYAPVPDTNALHEAFAGLEANGTWSLYIYDDVVPYGGSIAGGWSLMIATDSVSPTISDIPNQSTITNTPTAAIPFTVSDAVTPAASLTLSRGSSNPTLVPTNNIVFGGAGSNRTVTITPATGQTGTATVTVTVSDGTNTDSEPFVLTVSAGNTPPTIVPIAPQTTLVNQAVGPFNISIGDAETPVGSLTLSGNSSDTNLMPNANIVLFNGSGIQTLAAAPASGQTGTTTITIRVSDGVLTNNTSFLLTVNPPGPATTIFDKPTLLTIADNTNASPYPSTISVGGIVGTITNVSITLHNMSHPNPGNVDMLLVGPAGQRVAILSAVIGNKPMTNVTFTLSDNAQYPLPAPGYALPPGTYRPTDLAPNHTSAPYIFPAPAPAAPYATNLFLFNGGSPNGIWSLYVADNSPGSSGALNGGWSLTITTHSTRPIMDRPTHTSTNATLSWSAVAGVNYRVQHKADISSATWSDLSGDVTAAGTNATKVDTSVSGTSKRIYRIRVLP